MHQLVDAREMFETNVKVQCVCITELKVTKILRAILLLEQYLLLNNNYHSILTYAKY